VLRKPPEINSYISNNDTLSSTNQIGTHLISVRNFRIHQSECPRFESCIVHCRSAGGMEEIRLARAAAQEMAGTVTSISLMVYYHQRDVNTFAKLLQKECDS